MPIVRIKQVELIVLGVAQLKTGLAFHSVPTQTYAANSAWQQLVVLAHNLLTNFQLGDYILDSSGAMCDHRVMLQFSYDSSIIRSSVRFSVAPKACVANSSSVIFGA